MLKGTLVKKVKLSKRAQTLQEINSREYTENQRVSLLEQRQQYPYVV